MFIYKQYDQPSLDNQYNPRLKVPDYASYLNRWENLSRQTEIELPVIKDLPYGDLPREILDIYPSQNQGSTTLIFIHGGYWHLLDRSMFQFIARAFHHDPVTTVIINYPLAPMATLDQIVASCRKAVSWCYKNISGYKGDPAKMYVLGHSAGAHLAAMLLTTEWALFNLPQDCLKGACAASGLFNLIPIHHAYLNQILQINKDAAIQNSPVYLNPLSSVPMIIAVGDDESDEFKAQSTAFHEARTDKGFNSQLLILPGENHYSIIETTIDPLSTLRLALKRLMRI